MNQLETFDKSNLEVMRIEFAKQHRKLKDCQKEQVFIKPDVGKTISHFFFRLAGHQVTCDSNRNFFFFSSQAIAITQES